MIRRTRVYRQGSSTYVIGADDATVALEVLGISPETHGWGSTEFGLFVRRQGLWRACSEFAPPSDAQPGVIFVGRIVEKAKS